MAVNAKDLPNLFFSNSWHASSRVSTGAGVRCVASVNGTWTLSPDSDLFHVSQADFDVIAAAGVSNGGAGPYLVVDGAEREVWGVVDEGTGERWIGLRVPE